MLPGGRGMLPRARLGAGFIFPSVPAMFFLDGFLLSSKAKELKISLCSLARGVPA